MVDAIPFVGRLDENESTEMKFRDDRDVNSRILTDLSVGGSPVLGVVTLSPKDRECTL